MIVQGNFFVLRNPIACHFCKIIVCGLDHFILDCPALDRSRMIFGLGFLNRDLENKITLLFDNDEVSLNALVKFETFLCKDFLAEYIDCK